MAGHAGYWLRPYGWRPWVLLALAAVYGLLRLALWQWPQHLPPLLRHYLADLLCMPLVLSATWLLQRWLGHRQSGFRHSALQVAVAVAYFAVAFEGVLPHLLPRYTADPADVGLYALGGWAYYRWLNPLWQR